MTIGTVPSSPAGASGSSPAVARFGGLLWALLIAGAAGVGGTYLVAGPERFWINWLIWFVILVCMSLGALFIVALQHITGATWSVPLRRVPERLAALTLWVVPVALVALFSLPVLFSWTQPGAMADPAIAMKSSWLNYPFFIGRLVVCVALWVWSYRILVMGSVRQDQTRDPAATVKLRRYAPIFMILLALTLTAFSFDWVSSLEASWYSDIFGVYLFAGAVTSSIAATLLLVIYLRRRGRLAGVTPDHLYNLGGLLFGFTIFWGYIAFSQYLLQWYADLPSEVFWFRQRTTGGFEGVFILLGIGHFFVPFLALISRRDKMNVNRLQWVSLWVLFMEVVDVFWLVAPVQGRGLRLGWPEAAFTAFFVAGGLLVVGRALRMGADTPVGDPFLTDGLHFHLR